MTPATSLRIGAAAQTIQLRVSETVVGVQSNFIHLGSPDGSWNITVPRAAFSGMRTEDGEFVVVSLTLVKITVEAAPDVGGGLILPPRAN